MDRRGSSISVFFLSARGLVRNYPCAQRGVIPVICASAGGRKVTDEKTLGFTFPVSTRLSVCVGRRPEGAESYKNPTVGAWEREGGTGRWRGLGRGERRYTRFFRGKSEEEMTIPIWGLAKGQSIFKINTRVMTKLMPTIKEVKCVMNPLDGGHSTAAK